MGKSNGRRCQITPHDEGGREEEDEERAERKE